jgi:hypothetical protein
MMSTLSLSSPLFLAAPPKVQGVISCRAALASASWNSVMVHGGRQRRATIVNVVRLCIVYPSFLAPLDVVQFKLSFS